jgi:hypothetical protein
MTSVAAKESKRGGRRGERENLRPHVRGSRSRKAATTEEHLRTPGIEAQRLNEPTY